MAVSGHGGKTNYAPVTHEELFLCLRVTRMRDGNKGSASGVHAAEQTLSFAPERASGFGKTGETHPHPQLIQYPITAAHQSQEGLPGWGGAASSWHHKPPLPSPQPRPLKHFHYLPGNLTHHPARKQTECPLHTPQHPGAYKILQSVTEMAYRSHRALAKGPVWS